MTIEELTESELETLKRITYESAKVHDNYIFSMSKKDRVLLGGKIDYILNQKKIANNNEKGEGNYEKQGS